MPSPRKTARLAGKRWRVSLAPRRVKGYQGYCNYDTRILWVSPKLEGVELIDTILHEGLHGLFPEMNEPTINRSASELANLLIVALQQWRKQNGKSVRE